jgi:hypothetical protein
MTDRAKLEQMLQYLINEDKTKAEELFHELVVEKSREIYENLLDDDIQVDEETDEEDLDEESGDDDLEEASDDEDLEENFGLGEIGGDPADDMMTDVEADMDSDDDMGDMGDDETSDEAGAEAATKDDVMDIKDALEELKAEFEAMLAGNGDNDDEEDEEEDSEEDEEDMGDDDMDDDEGNPFAKENVREYVEKVQSGSGPYGSTKGDNGVNTKSIVAGKNNMGGTTANIVKGGTSETGGTKGGLAQPNPKDMSTGNVNVPGGNAGKTGFKKKEPGHGAEKKGTGDMGDKSAGSPINGAPKRAK